jgi:hypothetical protein
LLLLPLERDFEERDDPDFFVPRDFERDAADFFFAPAARVVFTFERDAADFFFAPAARVVFTFERDTADFFFAPAARVVLVFEREAADFFFAPARDELDFDFEAAERFFFASSAMQVPPFSVAARELPDPCPFSCVVFCERAATPLTANVCGKDNDAPHELAVHYFRPSTARCSCCLFICERPLTPIRFASP